MKIKVQPKVYNETKKRTAGDIVMEIDIRSGSKARFKAKFANVGNDNEGHRQNLHFIVREASRPTFLISQAISNFD